MSALHEELCLTVFVLLRVGVEAAAVVSDGFRGSTSGTF